MKNFSPEEIAQHYLDSMEDARPYLNRDVVIELWEMSHNESYRDSERALEIAEIALEIADILNDPPAKAWAIWAKGAALADNSPHDALPFYQQAEDIFCYHEEWVPLARLQAGLVFMFNECSELAKALTLAKQVRVRCRGLGRDGLSSLGLLEKNVGTMQRQQGQLDLALKSYGEAMAAYEQVGGPFEIARIKIHYANVYLQMDRYQQAEKFYHQARDLFQQVTPQPQDLFLVDFNLGLLAEKLGHYQKALHYLEQARNGFTLESRIASVNLKRAIIYNTLNLNQESLALAQSVTNYYVKVKKFNCLAQALHAQAIAWRGLGKSEKNAKSKSKKLQKARSCFLKARDLFANENVRQEIVLIDLMLAELALNSHNIEEAHLIADRLANTVEGDLWPHLAVETYLIEARILLWPSQQGQPLTKIAIHNAHTALQQALHFTQRHPQPKVMVSIYHLLSQLYVIQTDHNTAWSALCQAMAYLESMRANLLLDEFRISLMDGLHVVYQDGLRLLQNVTLFDTAPDKQTQLAAMFYLLNIAATPPFVQMNAEGDPDSEPNRKINKQLRQQLEELRASWCWLQSKLKEAEPSLGITDDKRQQENTNIYAKMNRIERQIADISRRLGIRNNLDWITTPLLSEQSCSDKMLNETLGTQFYEQSVHFCHEIQRKLGTHEALLHYFVLDGEIRLLLVNDSEICTYSLGSVGSIDGFKARWNFHMSKTNMIHNMSQIANLEAQRILSQPGQVLLEPLLEKLTDISHLYLVYPTEWHDIPFAALRTPDGYWVERFQLTHLSTPEALRQSASLGHIQPPSTMTDRKPHALLVGCSNGGKLPHNLQECQRVQESLSRAGWEITLLLGKKATRDNFDKAVSQCQILHVATHAESQSDNPLFSWMLLDDGPLTVVDIYHQTPLLNQALVVLSACQTGRGQVRDGGLLGMSRAWLTSGARGIVASLWKVEDQVTAQLMEYFYEQIDTPHTRINSHHLCQAQRRLATTQHPFFWAAFIYVGG